MSEPCIRRVCTMLSWCTRLCQVGRIPDNLFPKPIEKDALSAKWKVHIWNRLWKCSSRLYTGTLKRYASHAIVYRRLATSASPTRDIFSTKFSLKRDSAGGKMCLFCHMTSVGWLEIMIQHTPPIICDFHIPLDFRLDILFPCRVVSFDSCIRIEWG